FRIEREVPRAIRAAVKTDRRVRATTRNIFVDCLANSRLELNEITRQIDHDIALFPVHGIQLDSKFRSGVIGLATTVSSHASHTSKVYRREMFNVQRAFGSSFALRVGEVKALRPPRSIQTTAVRERFALVQGDHRQKG